MPSPCPFASCPHLPLFDKVDVRVRPLRGSCGPAGSCSLTLARHWALALCSLTMMDMMNEANQARNSSSPFFSISCDYTPSPLFGDRANLGYSTKPEVQAIYIYIYIFIYLRPATAQDYWHHWSDVLAGFILGCIMAYTFYRCAAVAARDL